MAEDPSIQAAFDSGAGHRAISHDRTNPHDPATMPDHHAAWDRGWQKTDRELLANDPMFRGISTARDQGEA